MIHAHASDDLRARAAAYVLGSLDRADARDFEEHLAAGCDVCRGEVDSFNAVADDLALAVAPIAPPPSVRARLFAELSAHDPRAAAPVVGSDPRFVFVDAAEGDWQDVAPGISRRLLGADGARRSRSYVIRMAPGATLRPHAHAVIEHCYIIQGNFQVAGHQLVSGDYHLAAPGTTHDDLRSEGGCLFLVIECQP